MASPTMPTDSEPVRTRDRTGPGADAPGANVAGAPLIRGIDVVDGVGSENLTDTITLEESERHRRRIAMTSDSGLAFLLDLPEARRMRHGEAIRLQDGRLIGVRGQPEPLYAVAARDGDHLLMLAWQVGNRHTPIEIRDGRLFLRRDPIIRAMLEELGARLETIEAVFEPLSGAYASHDHAPSQRDHHEHGQPSAEPHGSVEPADPRA